MNVFRAVIFLSASVAVLGCAGRPASEPDSSVAANYRSPLVGREEDAPVTASKSNDAPHASAPGLTPEPPPATAPSVTEIDSAARDAIGAAALKQILARYPAARDDKLNEYLILVGSLLTLESPEVDGESQYLLLDADRPFSFAVAPKTVGISRGLLARMVDESELAGVLARELANLRADRAFVGIGLKVGSERQTPQAGPMVSAYAGKLAEELLSPATSRGLEELADLEGARLAAAAKYAPDGYLRVLARLHPAAKPGSPEWQRLRTLDATVSIVGKAHPNADLRLPARFESYVKPGK